MSRALIVQRAGPAVTVQDDGRPGWIAYGLSRGGAMDRLAQAAGAALEMAGVGGRFEAAGDLRIALTGGAMHARIDGAPVEWHAVHALPNGAVLEIGAMQSGAYGYLTIGGGLDTEKVLGARSAHLTAGLGRAICAGDRLPVGTDLGGPVARKLAVEDRFAGGTLRVVESLQTRLFPEAQRRRLEQTVFSRDARGNRMGVKLVPDGPPFGVDGGLSVVSEIITPGDIQVTGDGAPFVLMAECQTTGGYPRLATVIPADLPRVAQAPAGAELRFRFVSIREALAAEASYRTGLADLPRRTEPLVRDPAEVADLLSHKLVSGFSNGDYHDH